MRVALPLGRANRTSKHRPVDPEPTPSAPDHELESYLAALAPNPEADTTASGDQFGKPLSYRVRLNPIADGQLHELAQLRGISPRELIQEWTQERLAWEADQQLGQ